MGQLSSSFAHSARSSIKCFMVWFLAPVAMQVEVINDVGVVGLAAARPRGWVKGQPIICRVTPLSYSPLRNLCRSLIQILPVDSLNARFFGTFFP
ncbi:unnamed protein product, partial [Nesidiocoris tenuis]